MGNDLVKKLDSLLDSNLEPILNKITDYQSVIINFLDNNEKLFASKLASLKDEYSSENYPELVDKKILNIENELSKKFNGKVIFNASDHKEILEEVFNECPEKLKKGFYLKEQSAIDILNNNHPKSLMEFYNVDSLENLFEKIKPLEIITISRYSETPQWQEEYKNILIKCTKDDFEKRDTAYSVLDYEKYKDILSNSQQPGKPWRLSHNKVTGNIICFTIDEDVFKTPFLQYLAVFVHYYFETSYAGKYYTLVAEKDPNNLGKAVLNSFTNHDRKFDFFSPNVYSENIYWQKAIDFLYSKFDIKDLQFFVDTDACGNYFNDQMLSLNLVDKIWDINLDNGPFTYHFREAVWKEVFQKIINLTDNDFEMEVISNLNMRDLDFTDYIINKYK